MGLRFSFFEPKGEPTRGTRAPAKELSDIRPTVDEFTAVAAVQILENQACMRIFDILRQSAMADISSSPMGMAGLQAREEAHTRLKAIDKIGEELQAMADDLKLHKKHKETD